MKLMVGEKVLAESICPERWVTLCAGVMEDVWQWRRWKNEHPIHIYDWDAYVKEMARSV